MARTRKRSAFMRTVQHVYEEHYKKLFLIPMALLALALLQIGLQTAITGDFINRGVSLKGGISLTVQANETVDTTQLEGALAQDFSQVDSTVRAISSAGRRTGFIVQADIDTDNQELMDQYRSAITRHTGVELTEDNSNMEMIGSTLGENFFRGTMIAVLLAFLFMGITVFVYFRTLAPSSAVILAAFSDIVVTMAVVNLMGIKLSGAGIAAFLMMIGYSVDTDILLSVRVLKRRGASVMQRVYNAVKTGLTMNVTTMVALILALAVAQSQVLTQIMTILLIGLFVDIINTWIQNVAILRMYLEKTGR